MSGQRLVLISDSTAAIGAFFKGRSSPYNLRLSTRRFCVLTIAHEFSSRLIYVLFSINLADAPSRFFWRSWRSPKHFCVLFALEEQSAKHQLKPTKAKILLTCETQSARTHFRTTSISSTSMVAPFSFTFRCLRLASKHKPVVDIFRYSKVLSPTYKTCPHLCPNLIAYFSITSNKHITQIQLPKDNR